MTFTGDRQIEFLSHAGRHRHEDHGSLAQYNWSWLSLALLIAGAVLLWRRWTRMTRRSAQRHFLLATGMTHRTYRQIQRARYAAEQLSSGASIADSVHQAGYYDQAT